MADKARQFPNNEYSIEITDPVSEIRLQGIINFLVDKKTSFVMVRTLVGMVLFRKWERKDDSRPFMKTRKPGRKVMGWVEKTWSNGKKVN